MVMISIVFNPSKFQIDKQSVRIYRVGLSYFAMRSKICNITCILFRKTKTTPRPWSVRFAHNSAITDPSFKEKSQAADTLTDLFGRHHTYLRISLTERCNLRCQYCMPSDGVTLTKKDDLLATDEIIKLAEVFVKQGVNKIRLTGGEPTVKKDIVQIIEALKSIPGLKTVAMTTNGLTLTRQLPSFQKAGLDLLNISLDTLKPERYEVMTRRKGFERAMAGIYLAMQLGYNPVKINCVVMNGVNEDEICDFVQFTENNNADVRFIEYMPFTGNSWKDHKMVSYKSMVEKIKERWSNFCPLPNEPNDTSKAWHVPGFKGRVGFISSMSDHFCGSCNRIRLTADGNLKVCLFGNAEISLRDALRNNISEDDLNCLISAAIKRKNKQHAAGSHRKIKHNDKFQLKIPNTLSDYGFLRVQNFTNTNYIRAFCSKSDSGLTHVDDSGKANMVDVSHKNTTKRMAKARGTVRVGSNIIKLITDNEMKKGDVLTVAQIAGIMAAKRTSDIIPLCHNINLSSVNIKLELKDVEIVIVAEAHCTGQTGVEMEALTAVAVAALTIYDMCKAVSHSISIEKIYLVNKEGGKSVFKKYNTEPITDTEMFYPTYV